jgi:ABC-type transporter Mla maintaining outer membrane lipid asymmetry ATPase subunit MlaF
MTARTVDRSVIPAQWVGRMARATLCKRNEAQMIKALSCRNMAKALGGRPVIADLDLDVEPPEVVALLGGSGSGEILLRVITGLSDPDRGYIAIGDRIVVGSEVFQQTNRHRHPCGR